MGRAAKHFIIVSNVRKHQHRWKAIRDNYPVSDWFVQISKVRISRWYLVSQDDSIIHKEIGSRYIQSMMSLRIPG